MTEIMIPAIPKGHYAWDDQNNCLEFVSDVASDFKEKKRRNRNGAASSKQPNKFEEEPPSYIMPYSTAMSVVGIPTGKSGPKTIAPLRSSPRFGVSVQYSATITLKDVKRVALDVLVSDMENIDSDISKSLRTSSSEIRKRKRKLGSRSKKRHPSDFDLVRYKRRKKGCNQCFKTEDFVRHLLATSEFDAFLIALLHYFTCFFEQLEQESRPHKTSFLEPSKAELQALADTKKKMKVTRRKLGQSYCVLILGLGIEKQHHMGCGKKRVSSTHRDKKMYEDLYLFCTYVVWVTFRRKEFEHVKLELGNMMRSEVFNPALQEKHKASVTAESKQQSQEKSKNGQPKSEIKPEAKRSGPKPIAVRVQELLAAKLPTMERLTPAQHRRKTGKRPAIRTAVYQRSTALISLLPLPKEESDYLFRCQKGKFPSKPEDNENQAIDVDVMTQKIGIIGERTDLFNMTNLMPKNMENEEDVDSTDQVGNVNEGISPAPTEPRLSRQDGPLSRVTTAEEK